MTVPVVRFVVRGQETVDREVLERPFTVVFDGNCNVCQRLVVVLRNWDRHRMLAIVPSQAPGVAARFPWIPARAYRESLQLIRQDGRTWQGAQAIEQLLNVLPRGRWISWVFHIPLVRRMADRFYRWFARNRYRMGCREHCQLRSPDLDFGAK